MACQIPVRGTFLYRHRDERLGAFIESEDGRIRYVWVDRARNAIVLPCGGIGFRGEAKSGRVQPGGRIIFDVRTTHNPRVLHYAYVSEGSKVDRALEALRAKGHKCSAC